MAIRVCHFSDWHGQAQRLPEADLYVCTGDMYPNFGKRDRDKLSPTYGSYVLDRKHEAERQADWAWSLKKAGGIRQYFGSLKAPIVCVRGNHDFTDLKLMFDGDDVHELINNELLEVAGIRVTGHRGIPFIFGTWNDETQQPELIERARAMPEADLFVTHYPPNGILDSLIPPGMSAFGGWAENVGLNGMSNVIINKVAGEYMLTDNGLTPESPIVAAHCFGHIHECGGMTQKVTDIMFSNAATTFNTFEIEPMR